MRCRSISNGGRDGDVSVGRALDTLADRRRRVVLRRLVDREGPIAVADLAAELATVAHLSSDRREVAIRLHHVLLPRLDAAGYVSYDAEALVVEPTDAIEELGPFLDYLHRKRTA